MKPVAACNLCGSTRWATREAIDAYRVVACEACGLVFVTPQPALEALTGAYDRDYYTEWGAQAGRREAIWRARLATVERLAGRPGRLLDAGCGTGAFLEVARRSGWEVAGTEFSPYAVETATAAGLSVVKGEVWDAPFASDAFDVVTCWHALEHATDPRRVLRGIHRLLRRGGWLVLATPNLQDYFFQAAYLAGRLRRPRLFHPDDREVHLFHFSGRTLSALVESAGFAVECLGLDRGAASVWPKTLINGVAALWFRLSGVNWGLGLEVAARKP